MWKGAGRKGREELVDEQGVPWVAGAPSSGELPSARLSCQEAGRYRHC